MFKMRPFIPNQIIKRYFFCPFFSAKPQYKLGNSAIVTGATSGIGQAICRSLLNHGVLNLVMSSTNNKKGERFKTQLEKDYPSACVSFHCCDIRIREEFEDLFQAAVSTHKCIDIMINNAGMLDENKWEETIEVNVLGMANGLKTAMCCMSMKRGGKGGTIVNIGSGLRFLPSAPIYTGSKLFTIGLTQCVGDEMSFYDTNVRVLALLPGLTNTEQMKRLVECPGDTEYGKMLSRELKEIIHLRQEPCHVGEGVVSLLLNGSPGSVWVAEDEKLYEIKFPEFRRMKA